MIVNRHTVDVYDGNRKVHVGLIDDPTLPHYGYGSIAVSRDLPPGWYVVRVGLMSGMYVPKGTPLYGYNKVTRKGGLSYSEPLTVAE